MKWDTAIVLTRDREIDQLCKEQIIHPFSRIGKRADKQVIGQALELLRKGVPSNLVAKQCGVREDLVVDWRIKNIPKKERILRKSRKISNEEVSEVCRLLRQGAKTGFLAKRYGVSSSTVTAWRFKYDHSIIKNRDIDCRSKIILKACRELKRGASLKSVSLKVGVPFQTVVSWRQKFLLLKIREETRRGSWKCSRYIRLKAYHLIKRKVDTRIIAGKLKVHVDLVRKWKNDIVKYQQYKQREAMYQSTRKKLKRRARARIHQGSSVERGVNFHQQKRSIDSGSRAKVHVSSVNKREFKRRSLSKSKAFVPIRKVHIPIEMKLRFLRMVDNGVPIKKLSKDLNVNELTLESWILNRDLLMRSNAATKIHDN